MGTNYTKQDIELLEVTPSCGEGWFWCTLYQYNKEEEEHPNYFNEWVEVVNGKWDYGLYEGSCYVCFVHEKAVS